MGKAVFPPPHKRHSYDLGTRGLDAKEILAELVFMSVSLSSESLMSGQKHTTGTEQQTGWLAPQAVLKAAADAGTVETNYHEVISNQ